MKLLGILAALAVALYLGVTFAFPSYTHRYRLTIEIDTPEGVRSGSSIIEVTRRDVRWVPIAQGRFTFDVRGEAAFVDLGGNRNVIALLAHGSTAERVDQLTSLPIEAYGYYKWDEDAWTHPTRMRGPAELKPALIPTLVTISDVSDPKTAHVVYGIDLQEIRAGGGLQTVPRVTVDQFDRFLGPGFRLKRVWIERTTEPLTTQIEQKIPEIIRQLRDQAKVLQLSKVGDPFRPHIGQFIRS
jgi:hypothetical protein